MVQYIRAKCLDCENIVVLTYEDVPAPPVEEGDVFEANKCPNCGKSPHARFRAIKRYS